MYEEAYVQIPREDLLRLLFAVGYTRTGLSLEDTDHHDLIDPAEFDRLGDELNEEWHKEARYNE